MTNFLSYYLRSLFRNPDNNYSDDYEFDYFSNSEKWLFDHSAKTRRGSLIVGIDEKSDNIFFKNFIDIDILPNFFNIIKKNKNRVIFLTEETKKSSSSFEIYIYESICRKFNPLKIPIKISCSIISDLQELEKQGFKVLSAIKSSKIWSIKYVLEYI